MHFCFYFEKKILLVRNFTFSGFSRFSSSNFSSNCSNFLNYCIGYFINCVVMIVLKLFSIQVYNVHANLIPARNIDLNLEISKIKNVSQIFYKCYFLSKWTLLNFTWPSRVILHRIVYICFLDGVGRVKLS